jgi:hypothetical protein
MKLLALIFIITLSEIIMSQNFDFEQNLYQSYEGYKEKSLANLPLVANAWR